MKKLDRVSKYLNKFKHLGIGLSSAKGFKSFGYVDISFASDKDFKSRMGVVITLGNGPIYIDSSRQRLNTKSSTEAELVGVSDRSNNILVEKSFD